VAEKGGNKDKQAVKVEIVNVSPELSGAEREEAKRRIERGLYGIFSKYVQPRT